MSTQDRKKIAYIIACVNEFARTNSMAPQESFRFLQVHGGIDFLFDCYDTEHLLSFADVIDDLKIIVKKSGGMIA